MTKRIYIVDDDEFLTSMYNLSIHGPDREITIMHDGEAAIRALDTQIPDLLILDLLMPKLDGFGVLEHIRTKKYSCPVIVLSNVEDAMDKKRCMEIGAKDYYCKNSTDLESLANKVAQQLA